MASRGAYAGDHGQAERDSVINHAQQEKLRTRIDELMCVARTRTGLMTQRRV